MLNTKRLGPGLSILITTSICSTFGLGGGLLDSTRLNLKRRLIFVGRRWDILIWKHTETLCFWNFLSRLSSIRMVNFIVLLQTLPSIFQWCRFLADWCLKSMDTIICTTLRHIITTRICIPKNSLWLPKGYTPGRRWNATLNISRRLGTTNSDVLRIYY